MNWFKKYKSVDVSAGLNPLVMFIIIKMYLFNMLLIFVLGNQFDLFDIGKDTMITFLKLPLAIVKFEIIVLVIIYCFPLVHNLIVWLRKKGFLPF